MLLNDAISDTCKTTVPTGMCKSIDDNITKEELKSEKDKSVSAVHYCH